MAKRKHQVARGVLARRVSGMTLLHIVLTVIALTLVLPFVWMVLTSLKALEEVGLESWFPQTFLWGNYRDVFLVEGIRFGRWYWNSIFVAACVTFLQVLTSSLAAFSFSRNGSSFICHWSQMTSISALLAMDLSVMCGTRS